MIGVSGVIRGQQIASETQEHNEAVKEVGRLTSQLRAKLRSKGLRDDSVDYILMATDPFHDTKLNIVGAPDQERARSLVFDFNQDVVLQKPGSVTGNWDAHVAFCPMMYKWTASDPAQGGYCLSGALRSVQDDLTYACCVADKLQPPANGMPNSGPVWVHSVPSGTNTFVPVPGEANDRWVSFDLLNSITSTAGINPTASFRLIGGAMEVRNTTSALNKQGSVVYYRNRTAMEPYTMFTADTTTAANWAALLASANTVRPVNIYTLPPASVAYAKQIGGVTATAAEGALIPFVFDFSANKPGKLQTADVVLITTTPSTTVGGDATKSCFVNAGTIKTAGGSAVGPTIGASVMDFPFSQSGAYFTGLSPETTLTVSIRLFVEYFPSPSSALYALSHPSPEYEPAIASVIADLMAETLPGYPVSMNAKGDYFRSLLKGVGGIYNRAKPFIQMAAASTNPAAASAGNALLLAEAAVKSATKAVKEEKKMSKARKKLQSGK